MDTLHIIERLNKECKDSLRITHYYKTWNILSYKLGSYLWKGIWAPTLREALLEALRVVKEKKAEQE